MDDSVTADIGGRLRRARENRGLSLHDMARRTKLSVPVLQAIERNEFTSLPGGMFRKAYVRTLAVEVGLNPNVIAADYCARFEETIESPRGPYQETARQGKTVKQQTPPSATFAARRSDVPLRIEMAATGWCWVAAQADGDRVMYRLLQPGERMVLEGQCLISLRIGDAGSVSLSINDGARRSPGRQGEMVELEVTPDNVEARREVAVETAFGDAH